MRISLKDVKTDMGITESYDIMNAIRNSSSPMFQSYVPLANANNVAEVGQALLTAQTLQNEFITSLVERIGLVIIRTVSLNNPLKKFKKGMMAQGRTIEEIYVDITSEKMYDPEVAETELFKREIPNVKALFHELNRKGYYKQTIQDDSLRTAFISWNSFDNFIAGIIQSIYNSSEVDEFNYMKLLIDNYFSKGLFTIVPVATPDTGTATAEMVQKLRATALRMTLAQGTRDYNAMAVHTKSDMEDLHLIIDADLQARLDVDVLAKAFNMDRTNFLGNVTVIDGFASTGLEAVLVDSSWFMVYDMLHKMETQRNSQGLYWNYYYHVWQVLSVSRFSNAVAFVSGDVKPVTQVIVDPVIAQVRQGRSYEFNAYIRANDGGDYDAAWKVESTTGDPIATGTAISADGVLTVGDTQVGELRVTATVTYGSGETDKVKGEALVTTMPSK